MLFECFSASERWKEWRSEWVKECSTWYLIRSASSSSVVWCSKAWMKALRKFLWGYIINIGLFEWSLCQIYLKIFWLHTSVFPEDFSAEFYKEQWMFLDTDDCCCTDFARVAQSLVHLLSCSARSLLMVIQVWIFTLIDHLSGVLCTWGLERATSETLATIRTVPPSAVQSDCLEIHRQCGIRTWTGMAWHPMRQKSMISIGLATTARHRCSVIRTTDTTRVLTRSFTSCLRFPDGLPVLPITEEYVCLCSDADE